ncbi:AraC family transcriptional regulator [Taibaiella sp. KBW10]|uniref:helix-turn-helix domain-containing protein n=1 Tax=Taibaiella sp. KBW10 TaxID=2153357 RepID=UPI000F5B36DA|nr:helix-turn-helix transcriptional regulator [Taibaiella sp. KBW10]RQO29658.1 AraC family transcriptional regulator [Taibaiella sp. KBW10]
MNEMETLAAFYKRQYDFMPDKLCKEICHFNVFKLEPFSGNHSKPVPYKKRDYFKITLLIGESTIAYADKAIQIQKQALIFSNPQIPYRWEHTDQIHQGYFCIFDQSFFHHYGNLNQYSVFQPEGDHVFELSDEQAAILAGNFERMLTEINSDYIHKYDLLRTIVYEMVHFTLRMQASDHLNKHPLNAAQRIATLFLELMERQFPIDDVHQALGLRSASDYAEKLNIHVNHLNRALKEATEKTTSQIIAERLLQEAKILLKQTSWTVSEIAYALGYTEVTHFNNFFKKHMSVSPLKFRHV